LVSELTKGFTSDEFPKDVSAVAKAKGADEVEIDFSPAGDERKPAEHMEDALAVKGTEIAVKLSLGSTLDEIADQKEKTIAEVLNGVALTSTYSFSAKVAASIIEMLEGPQPADELMGVLVGTIAEANDRSEILYRKNRGNPDPFKQAPTVETVLKELKGPIQGMPGISHFSNVPDLSTGVSAAKASGGIPVQLLFKFENFTPMKLMKLICDEF